jgi:hypothetical protein
MMIDHHHFGCFVLTNRLSRLRLEKTLQDPPGNDLAAGV